MINRRSTFGPVRSHDLRKDRKTGLHDTRSTSRLTAFSLDEQKLSAAASSSDNKDKGKGWTAAGVAEGSVNKIQHIRSPGGVAS